jgi:hypothetical protein
MQKYTVHHQNIERSGIAQPQALRGKKRHATATKQATCAAFQHPRHSNKKEKGRQAAQDTRRKTRGANIINIKIYFIINKYMSNLITSILQKSYNRGILIRFSSTSSHSFNYKTKFEEEQYIRDKEVRLKKEKEFIVDAMDITSAQKRSIRIKEAENDVCILPVSA